jgi:hypothetical protein
MRSLICHTRWPELRSVDVPYYGLSVVPMCHLNDGTGYNGQIQCTITIVGGDIRAIHLVAAQHINLVLSIRVPVCMLSKRLAVVELAIIVGRKVIRSPAAIPSRVAPSPRKGTSAKPRRITIWAGLKQTRNDVQGQHL